MEVRDEGYPVRTLPWDLGSLMSLSMSQRMGSSAPPARLQLTGSSAGQVTQVKEGNIQRDLAKLEQWDCKNPVMFNEFSVLLQQQGNSSIVRII